MELMRYAEKSTISDLLAVAINEKIPHAIDKYVLVSACDVDGVIVGVSQAFCTLSGFDSVELIGKSYAVLHHSEMTDSTFVALWHAVKCGQVWVGEIINRTKNDGLFWVTADISHVVDQDNVVIGYIAVYQDITSLKALEKLSLTDPMTGAYNRRYFEKVVPKELARAKRERLSLCFLMVDADHFKRYNDTYGHLAGDDVIRNIIYSMGEVFRRPGDLIFRLGGEEFAVLYPIANSAAAFEMADRARQRVCGRNIEHTGNQPSNCVTVSMGLIVIAPDDTNTLDDIYKYSDVALYQAKKGGRNRVILHGEAETEIDLF